MRRPRFPRRTTAAVASVGPGNGRRCHGGGGAGGRLVGAYLLHEVQVAPAAAAAAAVGSVSVAAGGGRSHVCLGGGGVRKGEGQGKR